MQNSSSRLGLCVCQARDDLRRVGSSFPNSRGGFVSSELCRSLPGSFDDTDAVFSSSDAVMSLLSSEMQSEPRFSNYFSSSSSAPGWLGVVAAPLRSTWDGACFYGLTEPLVQVYEQRRCGLLFLCEEQQAGKHQRTENSSMQTCSQILRSSGEVASALLNDVTHLNASFFDVTRDMEPSSAVYSGWGTSIPVSQHPSILRQYPSIPVSSAGQTLEGSFSAVSKPIYATNIRWKTIAEIYTIHSVLQLSNIIFCQNLLNFCYVTF